MVYIDDLSGQGASLGSSQARLIITGKDQTEEIILESNNENSAGKRYWLAGCLTTTETGSFEFISVNQFLDLQPNVEEPLHCHNRISVSNSARTPIENIKARITVVDALTDEPLQSVLTTVTLGSSSHGGLTDSNGTVNIVVSNVGEYSLVAELEKYVSQKVVANIDCTDSNCNNDIHVSMLPKRNGSIFQILLNWAKESQDLDLHVIQVDKNDNRITCETSLSNMNGCKDTSLNHNMKRGGINGSETITVTDIASKSALSYLIYADDNSLTGSALDTSKAAITITDGSRSIKKTLPPFTEETVAGARYWLAGCLQVVGTTFDYIPVDKFSRESPYVTDKLYCYNLFKSTVATTPPPFCENARLSIAIRDSVTNNPIVNATATVGISETDGQQSVSNGAISDENGNIALSINKNGRYVIKVESDGYIHAQETINVTCDIARCRDCAPAMLVPMSPLLPQGSIRMTMGWGERPMDLDIYAQQKDINTEEACLTYYGRKNNCNGVKLDLDNINGGNNGVETITFDDIENNQQFVYMVFVHHYGSSRVTEEFRSSEVHLTITDGQYTSVVNMDTTSYTGQEHWVAGCIRMVGQSYEFVPVNVFLNSKPDEELPNLCLEKFGQEVSTPKPYSWYDPRRYWG